MSTLTELADAVAAELATGQFDQSFQAVCAHQPDYELAELATLRVTLVPGSQEMTAANRGAAFKDCSLDIGIQKKVNPRVRAEIDAMLGLVEAVMDYLFKRRLGGMPGAALLSVKNDPALSSEHLDTLGVFSSVVNITYRIMK